MRHGTGSRLRETHSEYTVNDDDDDDYTDDVALHSVCMSPHSRLFPTK